MDLNYVIDVLLLAFVIASVPLYILIAIKIYRLSDRLSFSFRMLFISLSAVDLAYAIHRCCFYNIPALINDNISWAPKDLVSLQSLDLGLTIH